MPGPKRNQDRDNEICGAYLSGKTMTEVAREFGVSSTRITDVLKRNYVEIGSAHYELMCFFRRAGVAPSKFDNEAQALLAWQRYLEQRAMATQRGIEWLFSFEQWWDAWRSSGKWDQRGIFAGDQYVMSRVGDEGPYSVSNVVIKTHSANVKEGWGLKPDRYKNETQPVD